MKNKFKKSKIIVPALALITATTVASVTGTVAWFTASRAVTVSATTFETKTEGSSLTVTTTHNENAGTKAVTGTTTADAAIEVDGTLTHGSYNAAVNKTGKLYSPNIDDEGNVESYNDLGTVDNHGNGDNGGTAANENKWKVKTASGKIWYGVSWTMTFSQDADTKGYTNALLFDPASSTAKDSFDGATADNSTVKGLRIALITSDKCIVVANNNSQSHVTGVERYTYTQCTSESDFSSTATYYTASNAAGGLYQKVNSLTKDTFDANKTTYYTRNDTTTDATSWTSPVQFTQFGSSVTKPADLDTSASTGVTGNMYLGDINATNGLTVTAVAWFEGTDTNAITTTLSDGTTRIMSKVAASLGFYSRKYTKA